MPIDLADTLMHAAGRLIAHAYYLRALYATILVLIFI